MLDHLRALRPDPRPLQTAASASDRLQCAFWRQDFSLLMRTRRHAAVYAQGHQWNPISTLTDAEARDLFLDPDEVMPDAMIVALQGEDLVAVSSLRRTADEAQVDLGWTGVLEDHAAQRDELIHALVGKCLQHTVGTNWQVLVEVDEADTTLWQLSERLPLQPEPDWLTFAERE